MHTFTHNQYPKEFSTMIFIGMPGKVNSLLASMRQKEVPIRLKK